MKTRKIVLAAITIGLAMTFSIVIEAAETETVVTGLDTVWEISWDGSGNMYITERPGRVRRWNGENLVTIGSPNVVERGESGLMGMALDPDFSANSLIYFCYTRRESGNLENIVKKYRALGNNLEDEEVILKGMRGSFIHDGCRLGFGPENKLLVTMGDSSRASLAQSVESLNGKVLRINTNGSIPEDNPFGNSPVFTMGHRNPQGIDVRPGTEEIYISEHGPSSNDEINRLIPGKNYGWPEVGGTTAEKGFEPALWDWTPTIAPAGIAFTDPNTLYLATLKQSKLHRLKLNEDGEIISDEVVLEGYGRLRAVTRGPDGECLYIGTSNRDGRGRPRESDDKVLRYCPEG